MQHKLSLIILLTFLLASCKDPPPKLAVCICTTEEKGIVCTSNLSFDEEKNILEEWAKLNPPYIAKSVCERTVAFPPPEFQKLTNYCSKELE